MRSRAALLACISCLSLAFTEFGWRMAGPMLMFDDVKRQKARRRVVNSLLIISSDLYLRIPFLFDHFRLPTYFVH